VYEFQGAVCFEPPTLKGSVGHYTAVCVRDGRLWVLNDSSVSDEKVVVAKWLEKCAMLVYSSSQNTYEVWFHLLLCDLGTNCAAPAITIPVTQTGPSNVRFRGRS